MVELDGRAQRTLHGDGLVAVDGLVASGAQILGLGVDGRRHILAETRLIQQRRQIVGVGRLEGGVVGVEPMHRQFQRAAGVKAGAARVGLEIFFHLARRLVDGGPFGFEEAEVAHGGFPGLFIIYGTQV